MIIFLKLLSRKTLEFLLTLVGIALVCFTLIRLIPGDPVITLAGERGRSPEVREEIRHRLGLDRSLPEQFGIYILKTIQGDLGNSIITGDSVWNEFKERFPATVELSLMAMFFATLIAVPTGVISSLKRNSPVDVVISSVNLVGYSMPIFWWALMLIAFFSNYLQWTPVSGRISVEFDVPYWTGFYFLDTLQKTVRESDGWLPFVSALRHMILPVAALMTIPTAVLTRVTRTAMIDVINEDFIRTAEAKGLSSFRIYFIHALRNAMIPILTSFGILLGMLLVGAVLTETIFSWPGVGKWIVQSIAARDYPVLQSGLLMLASVVVITNYFVDLLYLILDPRTRQRIIGGRA